MSNSSPDENVGTDHVSIALIFGCVAGLLLAFAIGAISANAFPNCEINDRTFGSECEANGTVGFFYGFGTFVAVMLQAYIIGKILETNSIVKAIARVTLNPATLGNPSEDTGISDQIASNAENPDYRTQDANIPTENTKRTESQRTFGTWWFWVVAIVNLLFVGFLAMLVMFAQEFADEDLWSRLVYSVLHPVAAMALFALLFPMRPAGAVVTSVFIILFVNIFVDVVYAMFLAADNETWGFPLLFSVVPVIAISYVLIKLPSDDSVSEQIENDENSDSA